MTVGETVKFPRVQRLAKVYLEEQLTAQQGVAMHVGTKNPDELPDNWIRLTSEGGPRSIWEWQPQLELLVYGNDEEIAEGNGNLIHSLMLDAAGVGITVPESLPDYPWVRKARHISGPVSIGDEDLPEYDVYRIVVVWHVLPIPIS